MKVSTPLEINLFKKNQHINIHEKVFRRSFIALHSSSDKISTAKMLQSVFLNKLCGCCLVFVHASKQSYSCFDIFTAPL